MSGKNINFDDKRIKKSSRKPYGTKNFLKYFIGYNDNDNIRPLCIRLPQMTGNARKFDENATMSFIVKDKFKKNILKYGKQLKG